MQHNRVSFFDHDIFRVEMNNCEETATVPDPEVLAREIAEELKTALGKFR